MTKKKLLEEKPPQPPTPEEFALPRLKPEQYWEWRTTIAEMQLAERDFRIGNMQAENMTKDLEILRLKLSLFKNNLDVLSSKRDAAKKEYDDMKKKLEGQLKISLSGCVIDDITFEVKRLEDAKS